MEPSDRQKRVVVTFLVASLVVLAGCGFAGDDGDAGAETAESDAPTYPEVVEATTDSLSAETADAFLAELTEDGELTADGEEWVQRLERVAELGPEHRDAVATSIAAGEADQQRLDRLDAVLHSPAETQRQILADGLADSAGDGLLDGEVRLLGLDPATSHPTVATGVHALTGTGYDETTLSYLGVLANQTGEEFTRQQIQSLGLVEDATANGTVTASDRQNLTDSSGDGLLDATSATLGLEPDQSAPAVASLARSLADGGYGPTEIAYLERVSAISETQSAWEQAEYLGLLNETVEDGVVENQTVAALEQTESNLLAGFAGELALSTATDNETVLNLTKSLAAGGYDADDVAFLERAARLTESTFTHEQARTLGLLGEPAANGTVTRTDRARLADSTGDELLDVMALELGVDPATEQQTLRSFAEPLAVDGYTDTELAYLERIVELREYRDSDYERWAQAEQLELLDAAVENGTVTDEQLWRLGNDASNKLLNGMELAFGTDPELADTSGDGYADHLAWGPMRDLGLTVNPTEPDVYVELESVSGQSLPEESQLNDLQETFRTEPSAEPGPINLHFHGCDTSRSTVTDVEEMNERVDEYRTMTGMGFHYLLVNDDSIEVRSNDAAGVAYLSESDTSWMAVDGTIATRATPEHETSVIAHELGHSLGILDDDFEGVDSYEYAASEYNSVMNYNHWTPVTFSTGEPFDDYAHMAAQSFGSFHQDHDELEAMWDAGDADADLICAS